MSILTHKYLGEKIARALTLEERHAIASGLADAENKGDADFSSIVSKNPLGYRDMVSGAFTGGLTGAIAGGAGTAKASKLHYDASKMSRGAKGRKRKFIGSGALGLASVLMPIAGINVGSRIAAATTGNTEMYKQLADAKKKKRATIREIEQARSQILHS